ncbi:MULTISPECIES: ADP-glyceromanno-heptose 6-epimerase [unclassified Beijerinckia]|uniref:ADP-glyceromanno-heptose 6-epimerase n=1 Tax=unclassified Beijerinckia TaxID=2638183 RepID=UPI000895592D|nr:MULTISPECIES: ADP-glyceromanno-heptose 6-epimerase [unclassified Beijerinckia]MDH7797803.1 ADP-L-glycero-D-manno-heptose 6-epimerase [Beijerinckia sp. GAS462]SEC99109.1 ADP-glyceromanno-heptose 6-epimerase precursor [Beijerinckia sp. 28-YEA-48]
MIVVTGAAGFIGSNIVTRLNEKGINDIAVCDWLGSDSRWQNLRKRMFREFVFPEDLTRRLDRLKPSAIIHMGANSSTTATNGDEIMRTNFLYTLELIDWCAQAQVPLIYASSAATYGNGDDGFTDDFSFSELRQLKPLNLYGWSKHQIDLVVAERVSAGLPLPPKCIGLKFFNVYGPNEYHKGSMTSVVGKNFERAISGQPIDLFKSHRSDYQDGGQLRDFVHVDDAVEVALWFLEHGPSVGLFNVGTGQAASFRQLMEALFKACGREPQINYVPMPEELRERYQYFTQASMSNLRAAGYAAPFLNVEEGVARYVTVLKNADRYR